MSHMVIVPIHLSYSLDEAASQVLFIYYLFIIYYYLLLL